jgi:hypothetical protein
MFFGNNKQNYEKYRYTLLRIDPCHVEDCQSEYHNSGMIDKFINQNNIDAILRFSTQLAYSDNFDEIIAKYDKDCISDYAPDEAIWTCWDNKNEEFINPSDD